MNHTKRLAAFLLALALLLALPAGALAADFPAETGALPWDLKGKTVILHTNDVHGAIEGYAAVAYLRQHLPERGADVLLVDAGDFSQGELSVNLRSGADAIALMNAAGYDVATLGNHEFDYGQAQLAENLAAADFPIVCANLLRDGAPVCRTRWMYESPEGLKIGFFGVDTPESMTKANPVLMHGLTFLAGEDLAQCVREQTAALRAEGADIVIALTHLGVFDESIPNRSQDVFAAAPDLDFIIDGHSHSVMTAGDKGEPIQSTGTKFAYIGVIIIDNATKTIEQNFLLPAAGLEQAPEVTAQVAAIRTAVDSTFGEVIGTSEVTLEGDRIYNRVQETNSGDFIADAQLWYLQKDPAALSVPQDHLVSIINGGTIRDAIVPGEITRRDVNTVLPFGNTLCVVYATGAQLLEAMEASAFQSPGQSGGYPHVAGMEWTIDTTKPYDRGEAYPGSTFYGPASIRRVTIDSVHGQPFSLTDTYAVAVNDFLSNGGDTYYVFSGLECFDTGMLLDDIVVSYIQDALGGVIGDDYATAGTRERRITAENSVCLPTSQSLWADGVRTQAEVYNINGENYFKLRDVAMLLNGSEAQFSVDYDPAGNVITLTSGAAYVPVGGELAGGADRSGALAVSPQTLRIGGQTRTLCAFNLAGNNFYRIADLAAELGFSAEYDAQENAVLLRSA